MKGKNLKWETSYDNSIVYIRYSNPTPSATPKSLILHRYSAFGRESNLS